MRPFRFGVNLLTAGSAASLASTARQAEDLGYDVVLVPDHLGLPAPFPALAAVAAATSLRVGPFVLNAAFYRPAILAREIATLDQLSEGRLELGLGTGYVTAEFTAAGLEFGSAGQRVDHLERLIDEVYAILADPGSQPSPVQQPPPLVLGGNGDRMLRIAAARADIVAFTAAAPDPQNPGGLRLLSADVFADRVGHFEAAAGSRSDAIERNLLIQMVVATDDREGAIRSQAHLAPYLSPEELLEVPTLLVGTVDEMADQVRRLRDQHGITYLTVLQPYLEAFAPVIAALRA